MDSLDVETATLTLNLPSEEIEFLKRYARERGLTVGEVVGRFVQRLKAPPQLAIHPEVAAITGLVPANSEAEAEHHRHLLDKHR